MVLTPAGMLNLYPVPSTTPTRPELVLEFSFFPEFAGINLILESGENPITDRLKLVSFALFDLEIGRVSIFSKICRIIKTAVSVPSRYLIRFLFLESLLSELFVDLVLKFFEVGLGWLLPFGFLEDIVIFRRPGQQQKCEPNRPRALVGSKTSFAIQFFVRINKFELILS